jgi:hypothetical protein
LTVEIDSARLAGKLGTFSLAVIGYQFPSATRGADANWLVVRLDWQGRSMRVQLEGPYLEAGDLSRMAKAFAEVADGTSTESGRFELTEPILELEIRRVTLDGECEVQLAIRGEPALVGEHFSVQFGVAGAEAASFARALAAFGERFPPRPR